MFLSSATSRSNVCIYLWSIYYNHSNQWDWKTKAFLIQQLSSQAVIRSNYNLSECRFFVNYLIIHRCSLSMLTLIDKAANTVETTHSTTSWMEDSSVVGESCESRFSFVFQLKTIVQVLHLPLMNRLIIIINRLNVRQAAGGNNTVPLIRLGRAKTEQKVSVRIHFIGSEARTPRLPPGEQMFESENVR